MKGVLFFAFFFVAASASAQYYYKDIVGNRETSASMKAYLAAKVLAVRISSYDGEGVRSDQFDVQQVFVPDTRVLHTITRRGEADTKLLKTYVNPDGTVARTVDSSVARITSTDYKYDDKGNLLSVTTGTIDSSQRLSETEVHQWQYRDGRIERMLRIKNETDTMFVHFKYDDKGNISEEQSIRKGIAAQPIYYYYDAQNRLTDIVRYNAKAKRLLPETMFEYSAQDRVIQQITVPATGSKYLIWRYQYDARGLKTREAIYDKYKQLNGKIEYSYSVAE